MRNSHTNAQDAALNSTDHHFPWKWRLDNLKDVPKNGKTVFSCFSCGGGSSMGYKLAGYTKAGIILIVVFIIVMWKFQWEKWKLMFGGLR